jgi:16S rRNA (cytosine967-C5)-methyltransferase
MNYAQQYVSSAGIICRQYDGSVPLAAYLKQYFATNKKFGSRDRKQVSHLCYCYYRLGHALKDLAFEERIRIAVFLCQEAAGAWASLFEDEWLNQWLPDIQARISFIEQRYPTFQVAAIFPWRHRLSKSYDADAFAASHLVQPDLFLRIRPGYCDEVIQKIKQAGIDPRLLEENCLALPNGTKIDELLRIDREVVVQDLSSQKAGALLHSLGGLTGLRVWDCCAASGGKSILAWDILPAIRLTASDIRESIIQNLRKRFHTAGVHAENVFVADLSKEARSISAQYDLVICDAPCSGSGTWGRTAEQLYYFREQKIDHYALLQEKISGNVLPAIKTGGHLLYITCSVFASENELIVEKLTARGMQAIQMEWIRGYDQKADSMFAVLLRKQ